MSAIFEPVTRYRTKYNRVRCSVCGTVGLDVDYRRSWKAPHMRGHLPCELGCGKLLTVLLDGSPRKHRRCPNAQEADR